MFVAGPWHRLIHGKCGHLHAKLSDAERGDQDCFHRQPVFYVLFDSLALSLFSDQNSLLYLLPLEDDVGDYVSVHFCRMILILLLQTK
jgi:hypothetical protein